jgi:glycosyltransferase involved in cell wall biosynthesis
MEQPQTAQTRPEVSIIVPARNEEACLGACLRSLLRQNGVAFEVIVVDDHSTDRTGEVAASFAAVDRVVPPELRAGWIGKNNALVAGAGRARGEWLLFTDADTIHSPGSLQRSLAEAKRHKAALLSYSPHQDVRGFWERAIMPVVFAELAARYKPSQVSDPNSEAAAANGQYLLVLREAYDAVGGHAAVAGNLLEDVALARAIKRSGRKILFGYAGEAVRTRMYRSFAQLREGWSKNLYLLFPHPLRLASLRLLEFGFICASAAVAVVAAATQQSGLMLLSGAGALLVYVSFAGRIRKAHFDWRSNVLALFGLPIFSYLLWRSRLSHKKGVVTWKGRTYGGLKAAGNRI